MFWCKAGLQFVLAVCIAQIKSIRMRSVMCNFQIESHFRRNNNNYYYYYNDDNKMSQLQNVTGGN